MSQSISCCNELTVSGPGPPAPWRRRLPTCVGAPPGRDQAAGRARQSLRQIEAARRGQSLPGAHGR